MYIPKFLKTEYKGESKSDSITLSMPEPGKKHYYKTITSRIRSHSDSGR